MNSAQSPLQSIIMAALSNRAGHSLYGYPVVSSIFFYLFFFPRLISAGRKLDVYHTCTHDVALVRI